MWLRKTTKFPRIRILSYRVYVKLCTPLHTAAVGGQVSVIRLLLSLGGDMDAVNSHGNTCLHLACLNGQDLVVRELLLNKAVLGIQNQKGLVSNMCDACQIIVGKH